MAVHGNVAPGFGRVREVFERNFADGVEVGAACAAVYDGELVVDLWGGDANPATGQAWEQDTIINIFSTTKGMASIAVLHAASHGLFSFDDLVADHWPEFAANGKAAITIRQLLAHQAGLCAIDMKIDMDMLGQTPRS